MNLHKKITANKHRALILLCVFAFILRVPGLGWGISLKDDPQFSEFASNEPLLVSMAQNFTDKYGHMYDYYPKGFSFQIALIGSATKKIWNNEWEKFIMIGRMLSLIYGISTIYLLFFLVKELTNDQELAFLSSLFLTLTSLHVSNSHFATTDAGITFWLYLLMYCLFLYIRTRKKKFFALALISCGLILSLKLLFIALIPVIYMLYRDKWDLKVILLAIFSLFVIFWIANGGQYTLINFIFTLNNVAQDNILVRHYNRLFNLFSYTVILISSLGLPMFLLAIYGSFQGVHKKVQYQPITQRDVLFIGMLPLFLHFISICTFSYMASRHILLLTPFLSVIAAAGLLSLKKWPVFSTQQRMKYLLGAFVLYQLVLVCSTEYYFVFDNRRTATAWVKHNIPVGEKIYFPGNGYEQELYDWTNIKKEYKFVKPSEADYYILFPDDYFRYRRSLMNPFEEFPKWEDIYHPDRDDFELYQGIFKNEWPCKLVKKIEQRFVTPEKIILNNVLFGYGDDILIYERTQGS